MTSRVSCWPGCVLIHYAVGFIRNDVDTLLTTLHTANVAADTLFGGIEAFGKQGDYITCVLLSISLNVSFNSASDSIVHGLVLLLISINSSSFN